MNFREITPVFKELALQNQRDMAAARKYIDEQKFDNRMSMRNANTDPRDFAPMIAVMGIQGDTDEERDADIKKKLEELAEAFESEDHSRRKYYLDLMYDMADDFDPAEVNMNEREQVDLLFRTYLIEQTVNVKRLENPEYFKQRYSTPEAFTLMDMKYQFRSVVGTRITSNLVKVGVDIVSPVTLPQAVPDSILPIQQLREEYKKTQLDNLKAGVAPSNTIDLPVLDEMIPLAKMDVADIPKYSKGFTSKMQDYSALLIDNNLLIASSKNMQGVMEGDLQDERSAVYIDGKPYKEFIQTHLSNDSCGLGLTCSKAFATFLLNGRHRVDVVNSYRDTNGQMQYEAKTLRATVTPEQEELYMQQFSWFRRTFFNWWPFNIETLQEKLDRIANDPKTAARHASVCENMKTRVEEGIARIEEEEREKRLAQERKEQTEKAKEKEKANLNESVKKWEKDSPIGILGEQMVDSYETMRKIVRGAEDLDRYKAIAPYFAKQILYSRLWMEREGKDGNMDQSEKLLMGDGKRETIQKNIDNAVQKIAEDPSLKVLVLEKMGIDLGGSRGVVPAVSCVDKMMANGGCRRFAQEYFARVNEKINQNTQQESLQQEKIVQKEGMAPQPAP